MVDGLVLKSMGNQEQTNNITMRIFLIKLALLAVLFFFGGLNLLLFIIISFVEMIEGKVSKLCDFIECKIEKYERT
jgi:hypothetical protein